MLSPIITAKVSVSEGNLICCTKTLVRRFFDCDAAERPALGHRRLGSDSLILPMRRLHHGFTKNTSSGLPHRSGEISWNEELSPRGFDKMNFWPRCSWNGWGHRRPSGDSPILPTRPPHKGFRRKKLSGLLRRPGGISWNEHCELRPLALAGMC